MAHQPRASPNGCLQTGPANPALLGIAGLAVVARWPCRLGPVSAAGVIGYQAAEAGYWPSKGLNWLCAGPAAASSGDRRPPLGGSTRLCGAP